MKDASGDPELGQLAELFAGVPIKPCALAVWVVGKLIASVTGWQNHHTSQEKSCLYVPEAVQETGVN